MRGHAAPIKTIAPAEDASPGEPGFDRARQFQPRSNPGEKRSGLETAGFTSQTAFLLALGQGNDLPDV